MQQNLVLHLKVFLKKLLEKKKKKRKIIVEKKLIKQLKKKIPNLNQSELENILDIFSESIQMLLKKGKNVEIKRFWSIGIVKKLKENFNARNPATNELIYKPERVKVRFKPSKNLKKIINE